MLSEPRNTGGRIGVAFRAVIVVGIALLSATAANAQAVSVQRLSRTQPLLQMKTDFPAGKIHRLAFGQDQGSGKLWLYSAGEDKQVYRWEVLQNGGEVALQADQRVSWPIFRDIRGIIYALDVHHGNGDPLVAFGGIGVKTPQVQLAEFGGSGSQLTLLYNDGQKAILGNNNVYDLDFSPDGQRLAVGYGASSAVVVWDVSQRTAKVPTLRGGKTQTLATAFRDVRGVKFNSAGTQLALGGTNAQGNWEVEVWDVARSPATKLSTQPLSQKGASYAGIAWTRGNNNAEQWTTAIGGSLATQANPAGVNKGFDIWSLAASQKGDKLALLGDGTVEICRPDGGVVTRLAGGPEVAYATAISPDGGFAAAAGLEQLGNTWSYQVKVWRTNAAAQVASAPSQQNAATIGAPIEAVAIIEKAGESDRLAFSWPGKDGPAARHALLLTGRPKGKNQWVNLEQPIPTPKSDRTIQVNGNLAFLNIPGDKSGNNAWGPLPNLEGDTPKQFSVHEPSNLVAFGYPKGILVCDLQKIKAILPQFLRDNKDVEKGRRLANATVLRAFYGHAGGVTCLAWAKGAGWLVSGSRDGTIGAWSMSGLGTHGLNLKLHPTGKSVFIDGAPAANSPAGQAGFRANEFVTAVNNNRARVEGDLKAMRQALDSAVPGAVLEVELLVAQPGSKEFKKQKRSLTIGLRREGSNELGVALTMAGNQLKVAGNPPRNALGFAAGFSDGQVINRLEINGKAAAGGPADWKQLLERPTPGSSIYVVAQSGGKAADISARITHEALWMMYPQQDGNWWLATPQSRFDASPACLARLEMHTNADSPFVMDKPLLIEAPWHWPGSDFAELLHDEESLAILTDVLRTKRPEEPLDLILPPQFTLTLSDDGSRAELTASAVQGQVAEVSLWLNSHRLAVKPGDKVQAQVDPKYLRADNNILNGVAMIAPGGDAPLVARSTVRNLPLRAPQQVKRRLHFLGVGVTEFQQDKINKALKQADPKSGGLQSLRFTNNDVLEIGAALAATLQDRRWGDAKPGEALEMGYFATLTATESTDPKVDPDSEPKPTPRPAEEQPTEANIKALFRALAADAGPEDLAIVMFAGHGLGGAGQRFKFLAQDTQDINSNQGLNDEEIARLLGELPCRSLLLLDACHSGEEHSQQQLRNWPGLALGAMVLSACGAKQSSLEHVRYGHGLFSQALLEALSGKRAPKASGANPDPLSAWDDNLDGWLSVRELCDYAKARTPTLCNEIAGPKFNPARLQSVTFRDHDTFRLLPAPAQPK